MEVGVETRSNDLTFPAALEDAEHVWTKESRCFKKPSVLAQSPGMGGPSTAPAGSPNPEGDKVGAAWVCLCSYRELWTSQGCATMGSVKHGTPWGGADVTFLVTQETPWVVFLLHPVKAYLVFFIYIVPCFAANSTHLVF